MLVVLTGGTGGAKLIEGLAAEIDPSELTTGLYRPDSQRRRKSLSESTGAAGTGIDDGNTKG
jgi:hypothetical protein